MQNEVIRTLLSFDKTGVPIRRGRDTGDLSLCAQRDKAM